MAKDTSLLSASNVFKDKETTDAVIVEMIKDLNWIRSSIDNVPGMPFIIEDDKYSIIYRIGGYLGVLGSQISDYLSLPEKAE